VLWVKLTEPLDPDRNKLRTEAYREMPRLFVLADGWSR